MPSIEGAALCAGAAIALASSVASAADYYVSPLGSDGATGALDTPFRTIARGVAEAMPGDTVHVRGGRYVGWQNQINPVRAGTAGAWITIRAFEGELPILSPPAGAAEASAFEPINDPEDAFGDVPIAFIRVEGFVAYRWPTSGFSNGWEKHSNNIEVRHCIADGNGVNGFTFYDATGVTFENNIAAHNGSLAPSYSSGVNLYGVLGGAAANVVRGNVSFENIDVCGNNEQHPCDPALSTDGNGYILDEGGAGVRFESNLGFRNGGSCLRVTLTSGAELVNNTCYNNGLDTGYEFQFGEVFFSDAMSRNNIIVRNNLAVSANGQAVINNTAGTNANVGNNAFASNAGVFRDPDGDSPDFRLSATAGTLVNGGDPSATGTAELGFDPGCIVRASTPIQGVSFWQYAINYRYIHSIGGVAACFRSAARSQGGTPDMGAYESVAATGCQFHSDCPGGADVCTRGECSAAGQCGTQIILGCCASDAACDDGDACTTDTCAADFTCRHASSCSVGGNLNGTPVTPPPGDATGNAGATGDPAPPGPGDGTPAPQTPGETVNPILPEPAASSGGSSGGCALGAPGANAPNGAAPAMLVLLGLWGAWRRRARRSSCTNQPARFARVCSALAASTIAVAGCGSDEGAPAQNAVPSFPGTNTDPLNPVTPGSGGTANDPTTPNGTGGTSSTPPSGGASSTTPTPAEPPNTTPTPVTNPESGPAQLCSGAAPAEDGLVIDFGSYDLAAGTWGNDASGQLTGGTSPYSCVDDGTCPATAALTMTATPSGAMRLQATLPAGGYTGVVWWFGPCLNAAAFEGLQFLTSGSLGGALMLFKVQTHRNYPVDVANAKGACEYGREATKWSECVPPTVRVSSASATPTLMDLRWDQFAEGLPSASVTPDGLVGLEVQFQCQAAQACALDLSLGTVLLKSPPFAF